MSCQAGYSYRFSIASCCVRFGRTQLIANKSNTGQKSDAVIKFFPLYYYFFFSLSCRGVGRIQKGIPHTHTRSLSLTPPAGPSLIHTTTTTTTMIRQTCRASGTHSQSRWRNTVNAEVYYKQRDGVTGILNEQL